MFEKSLNWRRRKNRDQKETIPENFLLEVEKSLLIEIYAKKSALDETKAN